MIATHWKFYARLLALPVPTDLPFRSPTISVSTRWCHRYFSPYPRDLCYYRLPGNRQNWRKGWTGDWSIPLSERRQNLRDHLLERRQDRRELLDRRQNLRDQLLERRRYFHSSVVVGKIASQKPIEGEAFVEFRGGRFILVLPLPSRGERCEFTLRPFTETVSDLCEYVRKEDSGIISIGITTTGGAIVEGCALIRDLMDSDFHIRLNDRLYIIRRLKRPFQSTDLDYPKVLVAHLHTALNMNEYYLRRERDLLENIETIQRELILLEARKKSLAAASEKRTSRLLWLGLWLMGVKVGMLGRLTWFEYSWDITEPVANFVTYGVVIAGFAYFIVTRMQYEYPDVKERMVRKKYYKLCRKKGFDIDEYNRMNDRVYALKTELDCLRRSPYFPPGYNCSGVTGRNH